MIERGKTQALKKLKTQIFFINLIIKGNPTTAPIPNKRKVFFPPKNPVE